MGEVHKTRDGVTKITIGSVTISVQSIDSMLSGGYELLKNVLCVWENVSSVPAKVYRAEDDSYLYLAMKCSWHCTNWLFVKVKKEVKSPTPPPTPPCTPPPTPTLPPPTHPPVETPPPSLSTPLPTPSFPGKSTKVDTSSAYAEGYTSNGSVFTGLTVTIGVFSDPPTPEPSATCSPSPSPTQNCDPAGTPVATPPLPNPTHVPVPTQSVTPPPLPTLVPVVTPVPQNYTPPPVSTLPPVSGGTPAPTPPLPKK